MTRTISPMPKGVVTPRYWGDGAAFGDVRKPHWSWDEKRAGKQGGKRQAAREALLASF